MGKYKRLAQNTVYITLGTVGSKIISIIMLPLYTKWLTVEEFGSADTMTVYSTLLLGVFSLCISESVFIFPKNQNKQIQTYYYSSGLAFCIFQMCSSAAVIEVISLSASCWKWNSIFTNYIWLIYWLIVSGIFQSYFQSFTRCLDKMLHYSITGMIQTFSIAAFSILIIPSYGLYGFVLAYIIANFCAAAYSFFVTKQFAYINYKCISCNKLKEMLSYCMPLIPNNIMWWFVNGLNRPVMEIYLNTTSLGIYAVANKLASMLQSAFSIFGMSWFNSALDEYGKPHFNEFYNNCFKLIATFLFICSFLIVMLSESIVKLLTTENYYLAYRYIPFLVLSIVFSGLAGVVGCIFACVKKSKYYFYSSIWGGVFSLISLIVLVPLWGLYGVVISVLISQLFIMISRIVYSYKWAPIKGGLYYMFLIIVFGAFTASILWGGEIRPILYFILWIIVVIACRRDIHSVFAIIKKRFFH